MSLLKHLRRPQAQITGGNWSISCDCGWTGSTSCMRGRSVKKGAEVEQELEQLFRAHLPPGERIKYVLVDTRQVEVPENPDDENSKLIMVPRGNFLMPLGTPCKLTRHFERDGVRYAVYLVEKTGEVGELPVGEVRTADNRVFKLDSDA